VTVRCGIGRSKGFGRFLVLDSTERVGKSAARRSQDELRDDRSERRTNPQRRDAGAHGIHPQPRQGAYSSANNPEHEAFDQSYFLVSSSPTI
jgi:hypothetical protein